GGSRVSDTRGRIERQHWVEPRGRFGGQMERSHMSRRNTTMAFRRRHSGVAALLAMLFLVLFSTLALGFYASTTTSAQVAGNDKRSNDVQLATDSAIQFARQQMISLNLPYGTTTANLMTNVASRLG